MKERTREFLNRLWSAHWFSKVAFHHNEKCEIEIKSWEDAITHFLDQEFGSFVMAKTDDIIDAANGQAADAPINSEWDDLVDVCKLEMNQYVPSKVYNLEHIAEKDRKKMIDRINWIIIYAIRETEYSDVIKTHFYRDWCDILMSGHFACYWDGDIEQGEFVVI